MSKLLLLRTVYTPKSTGGVLLLNDKWFGYTLEDRVRPAGLKVPKRTAIPAGRYKVIVTKSPRFNREMPLVLSVPNYSGVRIHGGNQHTDTDGCILIANQRINDDCILGSREMELTAKLEADGKEHWIQIINTYPGIYEEPEMGEAV